MRTYKPGPGRRSAARTVANLVVGNMTNPPPRADPGDTFAIRMTVKSVGHSVARGSTVRFYLSKNKAIGSGDLSAATGRLKRLRPRRSVLLRTIVKVPQGAQGSFYLIACADAGRKVRETSERDNYRASAKKVLVTGGLDVWDSVDGTNTFSRNALPPDHTSGRRKKMTKDSHKRRTVGAGDAVVARSGRWALSPARAALVGLLAAWCFLLGACGADSGGSSADTGATTDSDPSDGGAGRAASAPPGVPEECLDAYPFAMAAPDLGDVALLPSDWPEPPVDATLCVTTSTVGGGTESAEYVTDDSEQAVEGAYLEALAPYGAVRGEDGLGDPIVKATVDGTYVEVQMDPGAFRLVLTDAG